MTGISYEAKLGDGSVWSAVDGTCFADPIYEARNSDTTLSEFTYFPLDRKWLEVEDYEVYLRDMEKYVPFLQGLDAASIKGSGYKSNCTEPYVLWMFKLHVLRAPVEEDGRMDLYKLLREMGVVPPLAAILCYFKGHDGSCSGHMFLRLCSTTEHIFDGGVEDRLSKHEVEGPAYKPEVHEILDETLDIGYSRLSTSGYHTSLIKRGSVLLGATPESLLEYQRKYWSTCYEKDTTRFNP